VHFLCSKKNRQGKFRLKARFGVKGIKIGIKKSTAKKPKHNLAKKQIGVRF